MKNVLDDILNRAHHLGCRDVIYHEGLGSYPEVRQISSFSKEWRWVRVDGARFQDTSYHLSSNGDPSRWISLAPSRGITALLNAKVARGDVLQARNILAEAELQYPACHCIYDPYGYRNLVYVLGIDDNSHRCKIGMTRHPLQQRLASLSTGCPYAIRPIAFTNRVTEAYMKKQLAEYRIKGKEWFDLELMQLDDDSYSFPTQVILDMINGL